MFKIGNSKELPAIPDHISEEGKDFVKQCLQRDPSNRPTAAQLLGHPFVTNAAPPPRPISGPEASEPPSLGPNKVPINISILQKVVAAILIIYLMIVYFPRKFISFMPQIKRYA